MRKSNSIFFVFVLVLSTSFVACTSSKTACRQAEERACQDTRATVEHFNQQKEGSPYNLSDCYKLIELRCSDG